MGRILMDAPHIFYMPTARCKTTFAYLIADAPTPRGLH